MGNQVTMTRPVAVLSGLALAAIGFASGASATHQPAAAPPPAVPAVASAAAAESPSRSAYAIPGDGIYVVGSQVKPGSYASVGTGTCYWARLSDATGSADSIIANNVGEGQSLVTIEATDVAFKTQGCVGWVGGH